MLRRSGCGGDGCCMGDHSDCCRIAILKCIPGWACGGASGGGGVVVVVVVVAVNYWWWWWQTGGSGGKLVVVVVVTDFVRVAVVIVV